MENESIPSVLPAKQSAEDIRPNAFHLYGQATVLGIPLPTTARTVAR